MEQIVPRNQCFDDSFGSVEQDKKEDQPRSGEQLCDPLCRFQDELPGFVKLQRHFTRVTKSKHNTCEKPGIVLTF